MTQYYIGCKLIQAWAAPAAEQSGSYPAGSEGYNVRYPDGYISWSPKEVFEKAYLPVGADFPVRLSESVIDEFIDTHSAARMGKTSVVHATLNNGFEVTESSACVLPEDFDEKIGEEIAMKRIKSKVWELLGFLLQTAINGVKH